MSKTQIQAKRLLDNLQKAFSSNTFAACYAPYLTELEAPNRQTLKYRFKVPESLCRTIYHGKKEKIKSHNQLSSAAILAIFDELSTYSLVMSDRNKRAGVSVHLSTEIIHNSFPGDEVTFVTSTDKAGKTLGFCTMELLDSNGKLLARGKHIKYLPFGAMWDFFTTPFLFPFFIAIFEYFMYEFPKSPLSKYFRNPLMRKKPIKIPEYNGIAGVFKQLGMSPCQIDSSIVDNKSHYTNELNGYEIKVKPHLANYIGNMHGGAVAVAVEQACILSQHKKLFNDKDIDYNQFNNNHGYIQHLDIRYISPMKGDLLIAVRDDNHIPPVLVHSTDRDDVNANVIFTKILGQIINKKGKAPCAEFTCIWAQTKH